MTTQNEPVGVLAAGRPTPTNPMAALQNLSAQLATARSGGLNPKLVPIKTKLDYVERELNRLNATITAFAAQRESYYAEQKQYQEMLDLFKKTLDEYTDTYQALMQESA